MYTVAQGSSEADLAMVLKPILCCCSASVSQAAPGDAATAWRRNIYADSMYAVPAGALLLHADS